MAGAISGERCISCEHAIGEGERERVVVVKELLGEVEERATLERLCLCEERTDGLWILAAVAAEYVRRACWCFILRADGFDEAWTWYWVFPNGREKVEDGVVDEASQLVAMRSRSSSPSVEGSSRLLFRPGEER